MDVVHWAAAPSAAPIVGGGRRVRLSPRCDGRLSAAGRRSTPEIAGRGESERTTAAEAPRPARAARTVPPFAVAPDVLAVPLRAAPPRPPRRVPVRGRGNSAERATDSTGGVTVELGGAVNCRRPRRRRRVCPAGKADSRGRRPWRRPGRCSGRAAQYSADCKSRVIRQPSRAVARAAAAETHP